MITVDFVLFLLTCVLVHIDNFISIPSYRARKFSKSPLVLDIIKYNAKYTRNIQKIFQSYTCPQNQDELNFHVLALSFFLFYTVNDACPKFPLTSKIQDLLCD